MPSASSPSVLRNDVHTSHARRCISDVDEEVSVEGLSILRNVTCTVNDDPICGLREMGEERMLSLLENGLVSKSTKVVMQVRTTSF